MPAFTTVSAHPATPEAVFRYIITLSNWPAFTGWGPLPGIVEASLRDDSGRDLPVGLGARIRVRNTDGSVHHEVVREFSPPSAANGQRGRYAIRMELSPPASLLMQHIDEIVEVEPEGAGGAGTRMTRRVETVPRIFFTWPMVWLLTHLMLKRAVQRHDQAAAAQLSAR